MSETPNYADRIAAEAGELDRVYAETLSHITAREVETIARRLRSLAGEMRDSAPPSPGDVTGPDVRNALENIPLAPLSELLTYLRSEVKRLSRQRDDYEDSANGELRRYYENTVRPRLKSATTQVDALRRVIIAAGSRGDVTGTPAQTMEPLTFARVGDYAAAKTIGGKLLLVDETEEGTPIATFHSIADGVRFWRFVERLVSRPDLTGETPPASAEREFTEWFGANYPSGVRISKPEWHAPKIFRAVLRSCAPESGGGPPPETTREGPANAAAQ